MPPTTDDEIREKYLERAIRELNDLGHDLSACRDCPRGNVMPVQGSGHPQADIFMLKYRATPSEIEEGVAFYGRAGNALMKSFKRLSIDPIVVFGTLCVKCPLTDADAASDSCVERIVEEINIVQPRIVVVMGEEALATLNRLDLPLADEVDATEGEIQHLTPTIDALYVPDIDYVARRGQREAALLVVVPRARRLVRPAPAVLINLHLPGLCPAGICGYGPARGIARGFVQGDEDEGSGRRGRAGRRQHAGP